VGGEDLVPPDEDFFSSPAALMIYDASICSERDPAKEEAMVEPQHHLADHIRNVADFPIPGLDYKDITTLLRNPAAFQEAVNHFVARYQERQIDAIAGIESRGFLFSAPLAYRLGVSLVPIRKFGRLPATTYEVEYYLPFGADKLQLHRDAIGSGMRVVVFDDLLATGRTAAAACELVEMAGGVVEEVACLIELSSAGARQLLADYPLFSLIQY
jgi:adenine phosphoribosyltransferase